MYYTNYFQYGQIINEGIFIIRIKTISLSLTVYNKISNKHFINNYKTINNVYHLGLKSKEMNNGLYPNTIDLKKYSILIAEKYDYENNIGKLYQYSKNIQILVIDNYNENTLIRNCILFKHSQENLRYKSVYQ
jgi:hypothetical protein